jgi:hypothetical protein
LLVFFLHLSFLPSFSLLSFWLPFLPLRSSLFLFNRERHKTLWDTFFSSYEWLEAVEAELNLNPVLVGDVNNSKPTYVALLSGDRSGDVVYLRDLFLKSLRPHKYVEGATEITFDSGIILNVADILFSPEIVPVNTEKLIFNKGTVCSTYSYWKSTDFELKVLELPFISLTKSKISDEWFLVAQFVSQEGSQPFERWFEDSEEGL